MFSETEKTHRRAAMECVIGTHRAEGITVDSETLRLMERFVEGEISLDEFSSAVRAYGDRVTVRQPLMAGAA